MSGLTGKLSGIVVKALTSKGKNSRAANAAIAKAAKSNDMSVDAYKKKRSPRLKQMLNLFLKQLRVRNLQIKSPVAFGKGQAREIQRLTGINPRTRRLIKKLSQNNEQY